MVAVIKTERRLEEKLILETYQFPPRLIMIASVFGIGEHSGYGQSAQEFEEVGLFNRFEKLRLSFRTQGVKAGRFRSFELRLKLFETFVEEFSLTGGE
jgi:hypothetical protein